MGTGGAGLEALPFLALPSKRREPPGFVLPTSMRVALATSFAVPATTIDQVRIVERSRFARLHGRHVAATTRTGVI